jgi:hypothetical protein
MSCLRIAHGQSISIGWEAYRASPVCQRFVCPHCMCLCGAPSLREHRGPCTSSYHATRRQACVSVPDIALASQLEGSRTSPMPIGPSLHACVAFLNPLSGAADSAVDCSLHRPMAWATCLARWAKMAQSRPIVAATEAAAGDAAGGGCGGVQDGRVD